MPNSLFIVDAFTTTAFGGNPAAVCVLDNSAPDDWMQQVASEMNLSETAFVQPMEKQNCFGLKWFTPIAEVALCGHATLATSHILWSKGIVDNGHPITFHTLSGNLTCMQLGEGRIELDFPSKECHDTAAPLELALALGVQPKCVQRNQMDVLVELESEEAVLNISPDFAELKDVKDVRGVIVTAAASDASESGYDFISRFFAPAVGIDEDPVTGSAHCALAPYWAKRIGKNELRGYQASKRGGLVDVRVEGDRIKLIGSCVTVLEGTLLPEPKM